MLTGFPRSHAVAQVASPEGSRLLRNPVQGRRYQQFRLPPAERTRKYGDDKDVLVEAKTQTYFYNLAQQDDSAPRIPKVYEVFNHSGRYFSVMEYVTGLTLEAVDPSEAVSLATFALRWLLNQQPPSHVFGTVGSVEGSCVRHHFFKDNRAPYAFANVQALQVYVNKVWFCVDCFHLSLRTLSPAGYFALPET